MNKSLILVVEDDTSVRNLITTTLKAHEYRYLTAPDGQSAILEASSHNPDIDSFNPVLIISIFLKFFLLSI